MLDKKTLAASAAVLAQNKLAVAASNVLGNECLSKGQYHEAIQHYSSAIGFNSTDNVFYYNRGDCYLQIRSFPCAIADARKVSIAST